ncbi:MAG: hypothetical protein MR357_07870 [Anaeroplasma sp.]|nr:hypothetical protein [Anaeroplasma sp.]
MNNKTKCMLTITLNENPYTHQKDYSTEVTLIDYNLEHPSFANECNLVVAPSRKKDDMKKDEITLVLLERKETALMDKLKDESQSIKNLACELVIGTFKTTGKDYYAAIVYFTEEHFKMYFLSPNNLRSLKHRDLHAEFERRQDIIIDDEEEKDEE